MAVRQNEEDIRQVTYLLARYVESPSWTHIRHPKSLAALASEIVRALSERNASNLKWTKERDSLATRAASCWIPPEELRNALNSLPGSALTDTDLDQRLKDYVREFLVGEPNPEFKAHCQEMYEAEKRKGTDFSAIVSAIDEWVMSEEKRLTEKGSEEQRQRRADLLREKEKILLSGADCNWTTVGTSKTKWCRIEGHTFRATPSAPSSSINQRDKTNFLHRVQTTDEGEVGVLLGKFPTLKRAAEFARQLISVRDSRIK